MPKLLLLCKGEVPSFLTNNLGPHWFRLRNATGLEAAKLISQEAGGSLSKSQDWTAIEISEPGLDAVRELAGVIREVLTNEEDLAIALDSLKVPLHALEEVARLAQAKVELGALFQRDPDATWDDGRIMERPS